MGYIASTLWAQQEVDEYKLNIRIFEIDLGMFSIFKIFVFHVAIL